MVGAVFVLVLASAGVRSAPGLLIKPLEADFGWSRGDISLPLALSLVTLGLAGPASGALLNRFGLRRMVILFLGVGAAGVALMATIQSIAGMYVYWGLCVGFGTGGVSTVLSAAVANTWFESRRGLVTGILGGASSAGQFVLLFPLIAAEDAWGWRRAIAGIALLLAAVVFPLCLVLLRSKPADLGLEPVGATASSKAAALDPRPITPLRVAARAPEFWVLAGSFFICGFITIGLIGFHFIPHASEHGFNRTEASGILTLMGAMNIVGTLASAGSRTAIHRGGCSPSTTFCGVHRCWYSRSSLHCR